MDKIAVTGGRRLEGRIPISGAKNAALPLMVASLLTEETLELVNIPHLRDITLLAKILGQHGTAVGLNGEGAEGARGKRLTLTSAAITNLTAPYDLVRQMRASFLVIGPLLARFGRAKVSLPGGCAIGTRPVDLHLKGLEAMGAKITVDEGYVHAEAPEGLQGAEIVFPFVSVGATENLLMAAVLAAGRTEMINAAIEPEVTDLGQCLIAMGAKIEGLGTRRLHVTGVPKLKGARYRVLPDRIETGTYLMAAAMAGGDVELTETDGALIEDVIRVLMETGLEIAVKGATIRLKRNGGALAAVDIATEPYPGFPTDLQAQFMALMTLATGKSRIRETVFENRFMHVPELGRLGAQIEAHGDMAIVTGVSELHAAPVMATDLRASASLVIAALAAKGETVIDRVYHLDRGFERIEEKLGAVGGLIRRLR